MLPQTRSSSYHGVESTFRPNGVNIFNNIQILNLIVLPQTEPSSFHGVEKTFRLDVMQPFRKHSSWWLGRAPQHPLSRPSSFRGVKHVFFWCYKASQQRSNERLVVLPQTRSSSIHGVESNFRPDASKLFKNIPKSGWVVLSLTRPSSFHGVEKLFCFDVMQPFKNFQVDGWAALPNIPCHGPARFTAVNIGIVLMLGKLSTTFKWTTGRAPPNTVQLNSRSWVNFSSGCQETF